MKDLREGFLLLEDGKEFPGLLFGAHVSADSIRKAANKKDFGYGEVVFNTSMTGYQEILTDPSYYGQMVCMTVPHIGNTGVNSEDAESLKPWCSGFIVHENCDTPSNWRATGNLDDYLKNNQIPGIYKIDTRALTRHLRTKGVVRGVILPATEKHLSESLLKELPGFEGRDLISEVTTQVPYKWTQPKNPTYRVVAMDFGIKLNILRSLEALGCAVEVVPAQTSAKEILALNPQGIFLSNGPGDPSAATYATKTVRELVGQVPVFGICMGHQILAQAMGAKTYKLKFGHRGGNQPVIELSSKKVEISSHNHGYAVDGNSLPPGIEVTHINLNDKTVEGLVVKGQSAFSVQYHPESCPGPHDSMILFDRFIENMKNYVSKIS